MRFVLEQAQYRFRDVRIFPVTMAAHPEIRRIAALTSAHGVRLAPHAWGSGVLFAASIHVAMAAPNCHILEVSQGYMPMMWELFNEPFDIRADGMVHAPDRPGLGFTLRADALERFRYVDGPEYKF